MIALALVPAAAAVAGGLVLLRLHYQPPTVPEYTVVGDDGGAHAIDRSGRFDLELRPQSTPEGAIGARAFLLRVGAAPATASPEVGAAGGTREGGAHPEWERVRPWDPWADAARDGTVRISGATADLFAGVPDGPWDVAVAVGRPEVLPTAPRDIAEEIGRDRGPSAAWRLVVERIVLGPGTTASPR
jgi:hypothetical protein